MLSPTLLTQPARHGARVVAARLLNALVRANARLQKGDDPRSLHDVRVALRKLRTWTRAMRPALDDTVRPRIHRKLRKLARATGRARDLEVQLSWLKEQPDAAAPDTSIASEIHRAWQERYDASVAEARTALGHNVEKIAKRLRGPLSHYRIDVPLDGPLTEPILASLAADLVRRDMMRLNEKLGALHGPNDAAPVHEARIAGKRLRYLLEPFAPTLDGAVSVVRRLTRLQDTLGEVHDAQFVAGALERFLDDAPERRADAASLLQSAQAATTQAYERAERQVLGSRAEALLADARQVATMLSNTSSAKPEIERKFLLSALPRIARRSASARIEQGYLAGAAIEERVRRTTNGTGTTFQRTVKAGHGLERIQVEEETDEAEFRRLWRLTKGRRVRKRRYYVPDGNLTWEIDVFQDPPMILAEVELPSSSTTLTIPSWIEHVVVREVTDDPEYANVRLAR